MYTKQKSTIVQPILLLMSYLSYQKVHGVFSGMPSFSWSLTFPTSEEESFGVEMMCESFSSTCRECLSLPGMAIAPLAWDVVWVSWAAMLDKKAVERQSNVMRQNNTTSLYIHDGSGFIGEIKTRLFNVCRVRSDKMHFCTLRVEIQENFFKTFLYDCLCLTLSYGFM